MPGRASDGGERHDLAVAAAVVSAASDAGPSSCEVHAPNRSAEAVQAFERGAYMVIKRPPFWVRWLMEVLELVLTPWFLVDWDWDGRDYVVRVRHR